MSDTSVLVAVRSRPMNKREGEENRNRKNPFVLKMNQHQTTVFCSAIKPDREDKTFGYDFSFWSSEPNKPGHITQEKVYDCLGKELLNNAFGGYNACIFAYGQTGSGKTYTMSGNENAPGLIPRICQEMFQRIAENTNPNLTYKVECAYMEIYNERVRDLLSMDNKKTSLRVREHKILGPYVDGLRSFAVNEYSAIEALMAEGTKSRVTASTAMNDQSSRSHAVFTISITQSLYDEMTDNTGEKTSKVSLVDLAGSERVSRSKAEGDRLREGGSINKSLHTLGLVISTLGDIATGKKKNDGFVPYRDSILTWLLKENLGGNSKTVMIATVSPTFDNFEETMSTLRYADTAKKIKTHAIVNEDANARLIRDLKDEVQQLRAMLSGSGVEGLAVVSDAEMLALREKLKESERLMQEMTMSWEEKLKIANTLLEERARQMQEMGITVQGRGIAVDDTKTYLLNLNREHDSNELVVYHLHAVVTRIGAGKDQDIRLRGENILDEHLMLVMEGGILHAIPSSRAVVHINDDLILEKSPLTHGSTLRLADSKEFRINCPTSSPRKAAPVGNDEEDDDVDDGGKSAFPRWPGSKLHRACEDGDIGQVQYLIGGGLPPNSPDARWERPPLMLAADHGHLAVCKLLIKLGATAGKADTRGFTPLHAAADSGHLEVCEILLENDASADPHADIGVTPLQRSAHMGHLEVTELLLKHGADINAQDSSKGWTPLHLACLGGHTKVALLLISAGAKLNTKNRFGETPMHMAAEPGNVEIVEALLARGADPNVTQVYGRTAFDYAAEMTSFLLLHSTQRRLKSREQVCRMLYPKLSSQQKSTRSLTERKTIVAAVGNSAALEKARNGQASKTKPGSGKKTRPGTSSSSSSSRPGSAKPKTAFGSRVTTGTPRPSSAGRPGSSPSSRIAAAASNRRPKTPTSPNPRTRKPIGGTSSPKTTRRVPTTRTTTTRTNKP